MSGVRIASGYKGPPDIPTALGTGTGPVALRYVAAVQVSSRRLPQIQCGKAMTGKAIVPTAAICVLAALAALAPGALAPAAHAGTSDT